MKLNSRCKKLAKNLCANYFSNDGCYHYEYDNITCIYDLNQPLKMLRCAWFEQAVLPTDGVLEVEYWNELLGESETGKQIDYCNKCGKEIVKNSPRQKYCQICGHNQNLKSKREHKNKKQKQGVK